MSHVCSTCRTPFTTTARGYDALLQEFIAAGWIAIAVARDRLDGSHARHVLHVFCKLCTYNIDAAIRRRDVGEHTLPAALHLTRKPSPTRTRRSRN